MWCWMVARSPPLLNISHMYNHNKTVRITPSIHQRGRELPLLLFIFVGERKHLWIISFILKIFFFLSLGNCVSFLQMGPEIQGTCLGISLVWFCFNNFIHSRPGVSDSPNCVSMSRQLWYGGNALAWWEQKSSGFHLTVWAVEYFKGVMIFRYRKYAMNHPTNKMTVDKNRSLWYVPGHLLKKRFIRRLTD